MKNVLTTMVAPARRELGCYLYDLLQSSTDPRDFCFVERWENEKALEQHEATEHFRKGLADAADLIEAPAQGGRYTLL